MTGEPRHIVNAVEKARPRFFNCVDYKVFSKSRFAAFRGTKRRGVEKKFTNFFSTASTLRSGAVGTKK